MMSVTSICNSLPLMKAEKRVGSCLIIREMSRFTSGKLPLGAVDESDAGGEQIPRTQGQLIPSQAIRGHDNLMCPAHNKSPDARRKPHHAKANGRLPIPSFRTKLLKSFRAGMSSDSPSHTRYALFIRAPEVSSFF
jgi:hypothetical protein